MSGKEPVFTSKATAVNLLHHRLNMLVDRFVVWLLVRKVRNTNPSLVTSGGSLKLECLSDFHILASIVIGSLDPNDGNRCALNRGLWSEKDNTFSECHLYTSNCG